MGATLTRKPVYRSLFWPIVLIGTGVIWLLVNLNVFSATNILVLLRLWPLILIVVGLDLLFGRRSTLIGGLLGLGTVGAAVVLMLVGPSIGLIAPSMEITTDTFTTALEDRTAAIINLDTSLGEVTVDTLHDSNDLIQAEIAHVGEIEFEQAGQTISLSQKDDSINSTIDWLATFMSNKRELYWNVNLNPNVPLALNINSGVGNSQYHLNELLLTGLDVEMGVGNATFNLPAMPAAYTVNINGGAGTTDITLADDSAMQIFIDGGVGNVTIDVPHNAAVRVEANTGVGGIDLPGNFVRVGGDDESSFIGAEGTWETASFSRADRQILITFSGGVGELRVR